MGHSLLPPVIGQIVSHNGSFYTTGGGRTDCESQFVLKTRDGRTYTNTATLTDITNAPHRHGCDEHIAGADLYCSIYYSSTDLLLKCRPITQPISQV